MMTIAFRKVTALRGPNLWSRVPVLEAWVEVAHDPDETPVAEDRAFVERLESRFPAAFHGQGPANPYRPGQPRADAVALIALQLQRSAGVAGGFHRTQPTHEGGVFRVAMSYEEEDLARACLDTALAFCQAVSDQRPFDLAVEFGRLRDLAHQTRLGPSTMAIVKAARDRGIPVRRLGSGGSLVRLGHGDRQRRVLTAETERTGAIAEWVAQDKELTREMLAEAGIPVPEGRSVRDADDAWTAAQEIGGPVVVKPRYGNQGRGVATNLSTRDQVVAAFEAAMQESAHVVVERFAPGSDYRLLVVGQRLVAAARREPAQVVGDGVHSIAALVEEINRDPRRSEGHATALSPIPLDTVSLGVLAEQGYTPDSVPPAGDTVLVRRNANLSTGGTAEDVTDRVHPEVAARAIDAARVVGLDVAGIDIVARTVDRPLEEHGGVIVEVNAGPGLRMHLEPSSGTPRPVGEAIVGSLFAEGDDGRIPLVAVTGVNGKTTTTRLIAHVLQGTGRRVGMICTDGIYLDGRKIEAGDCSGPASARAVLGNPSVEAAVLETARGGILRGGLGFDACHVAVVTNIGEGDHLGLADITTPAELARVKRTVVDVVLPHGAAVLKADDPHVVAMAPFCPGSVVFFARDPDHPVLVDHRTKGNRGVLTRDGMIVLAEGADETPLLSAAAIPLTHGGRIGFQVENVLAATAAAWALGVPPDRIRASLTTFRGDEQQAPGRFNVLEVEGLTIVADYGHNPSAVSALAEAIDHFPNLRRTIVFTAAGDRRDADIARQGEILGDAVDRVILYEDKSSRGRSRGEIKALLRLGFARGRRVTEILEADNEADAISHALKTAIPGDLIVIQSDVSGEQSLSLLRETLAHYAPRAVSLDEQAGLTASGQSSQPVVH